MKSHSFWFLIFQRHDNVAPPAPALTDNLSGQTSTVKGASAVSVSFQQQVENIRLALMRQLGSGQSSQPPPYDPNTVEKFCQDNGGPTIFTEIVKMMTLTKTNRACTTKQETDARNEAVVVLYTMCYSQSKLCNWMQKDMAVFLHSHGLSDIGLVGMHKMGLSVSKQTFHKFIHHARASHQQHINDIIKHATNCEKRISLMVDDYTNIHTFRRPTSGQSVGTWRLCSSAFLTNQLFQPVVSRSAQQMILQE